jgi:hypothetical protein
MGNICHKKKNEEDHLEIFNKEPKRKKIENFMKNKQTKILNLINIKYSFKFEKYFLKTNKKVS